MGLVIKAENNWREGRAASSGNAALIVLGAVCSVASLDPLTRRCPLSHATRLVFRPIVTDELDYAFQCILLRFIADLPFAAS